MEPQQAYWHHNLSPFVFELKNLPLGWFAQPLGMVTAALFWAVLLVGCQMAARAARAGKPWPLLKSENSAMETFFNVLTAAVAFAAAVFLFQNQARYDMNIGLRWYSTMYILGYMFTWYFCMRWIRKGELSLTPDHLMTLIMYCVFGMLLGARLAYVFIYNWDEYSSHMGDIIKVWQGGLSFHGGIIGVSIAVWLFCRKYKIPMLHLLDKFALTVPFGVGIGRIGNFINGELYGRVIHGHVPWAVIFADGKPRHPSQIYQSLGEGFALLALLWWVHRKPRKEGTLFSMSIIFYGLFRFVVEFFREADAQLSYYFNDTLTMGQILCLATSLVGVGLYYMTRNNVLEKSEAWNNRIVRWKKEMISVDSATEAQDSSQS